MTDAEPPARAETAERPDLRFWLRAAAIYVVLNLPLLFLTLDTYNLNGDVYSSSYLYLGLNPYHAATNVGQGSLIIPGAGYLILPYNMVAFLAYPAFGFNAIATSALLKAIGLVAGFLAAWLAYQIAVREAVPNARAIFYAVLFNPFLIFVNSVMGDADLLVVFFVFLAVYLFRYGGKTPVHRPALVLGTVALSLTVLSFYFTLLFVPTILLWLDGWRKRLLALALLAVVVTVFALPILLLGLGSSNTTSLLGSVQVTGYSFPYYLPHSWTEGFGANQLSFTALAAVLSVLIPVLFRQWKVGEGTTLLAVLAVAFALTFRLPSDVFAILAALIPLSFATSGTVRRASYWTCLIFQAFLVPVYLLVEMLNGPGQVSGIYYWVYPFLHQNTILYARLGGSRVAQALFWVYLAGSAATIAFLVVRERALAHPGPRMSPPPVSQAFPPTRVTRWSYVVAFSVAFLLVAIPVGISVAPAAPTAVASHGQLNSQEFYAYDTADPLLYPLSSPSTFSVDSATGTFTVQGGSAPVGLARAIAATTNRVNLTVMVDPSTNIGPVPVWSSNRTEVLYSSMLSLLAGTSSWALTNEPVPSAGPPILTPVIDAATPTYALQGQSALEYVEPWSTVVGHREVFGAEYTQPALTENTLWAATFGPGKASWCFVDEATLYLGVENGTTWTFDATVSNVAEDEWFLGGFDVDPVNDTVSTFANGANLTLPLALPETGNFTFYLGKYNLSESTNDREAWFGNVTTVYSLTPSQLHFVPGFFASTLNRSLPFWVAGGNSVRIEYWSTLAGGSIRVNETNLSFSGADALLVFGKLAASPAGFTFQVEDTYFARSASGVDLGWVVLGFGVLLPLWLFVWCSRELWISLRRRPSLPVREGKP